MAGLQSMRYVPICSGGQIAETLGSRLNQRLAAMRHDSIRCHAPASFGKSLTGSGLTLSMRLLATSRAKLSASAFVGKPWFIFKLWKTLGPFLLMRTSVVKPSRLPQVVIKIACDLYWCFIGCVPSWCKILPCRSAEVIYLLC